MQGRDTKPGAEETSKTVLRKFPRKSNIGNTAQRLPCGLAPLLCISFRNLSAFAFGSALGSLICLHIFRPTLTRQSFGISVQSDEKSDSASAALSLCGIAYNIRFIASHVTCYREDIKSRTTKFLPNFANIVTNFLICPPFVPPLVL